MHEAILRNAHSSLGTRQHISNRSTCPCSALQYLSHHARFSLYNLAFGSVRRSRLFFESPFLLQSESAFEYGLMIGHITDASHHWRVHVQPPRERIESGTEVKEKKIPFQDRLNTSRFNTHYYYSCVKARVSTPHPSGQSGLWSVSHIDPGNTGHMSI